MDNLSVMSIRIDHRTNSVSKVQEILTKNGDMILGRFGIHDPEEVNTGLITLNLRADMKKINDMMQELDSLEGVKVNHMQV
ncbi:hypothetical protein SAMN02745883_01058 [Caminicella sporogenes DSM 14501]|uniref:ACT domain-containing protein n=1 Tax=Caminicella sporogenes DSM 14501 TaxID=1121266 RepID=A0A1M6P123_9FIRM|nr:hypothetical protein [Caminicella sporogenes]RKD21570.1 hypothetical protein BET04_07555 [Caminicella sporogenes]WIF94148.1 hypothetical protein QNI18_07485 [Caminicella sporogenes]SHK01572.1 hypothetical protein SAMN02745883_01058 [Caminicella sporogenes DSM 14501]